MARHTLSVLLETLAFAPLLVTAAIAILSIGVYELVMRTPARVVFELPRPVRRALLR